MEDRKLSQLDRLLAGMGRAIRNVAAPPTSAERRNPAENIPEPTLSPGATRRSAGLMRVNHAGEIAAQGLYQGHAAVARDPAIADQIQQAANEEQDHLRWCEERLSDLGSRPSYLGPLWYSGAWAMGAASGVLGDKWSLGFIEETERQVAEHLSGHLDRLPDGDTKSKAIVRQMRDEEQQHGANAKHAGAAALPTPVPQLMRVCAKVMTETSYWV